MGYTHRYTYQKAITKPQWKKITGDLENLLKEMPVNSASAGACYLDEPLEIFDGLGEEKVKSVVFTENADDPDILAVDEVIQFNGDESKDLSHEDFYLIRKEKKGHKFSGTLTFCKTNRKPYDLLVCATLILVHTYAPNSRDISSDGDADDWLAAYRWLEGVLGEGKYQLPISGNFTDEAEVDVKSWLAQQQELKQDKLQELAKTNSALKALQSTEGSFYF